MGLGTKCTSTSASLVVPEGTKRKTSYNRNHPDPQPTRTRRAKGQIQQEKACKAQEDATQADIQKSTRSKSVQKVAAVEDSIRCQQKELESQNPHPHINIYQEYETTKSSTPESEEDDHDMPMPEIDHDSDLGVPQMSDYPGTSDLEGISFGNIIHDNSENEEERDLTADIGRDEVDQDQGYLDSQQEDSNVTSDEDEELYQQLKKKRQQKKKEKGALRGEVGEARKVRPGAAYGKKLNQKQLVVPSTNTKAPSGLPNDWRNCVQTQQPPVPKPSRLTTTQPVPSTSPATIILPTFPAIPVPVRQSKATVLKQKHGTKSMGLVAKTVSISDDLQTKAIPSQVKKRNYTFCDLPFGNDRTETAKWQEKMMPIILDFAGSVDLVFGVTSMPQFDIVVKEVWEELFGDKYKYDSTVLSVATSGVCTWQSEIGKRALKVVVAYFKNHSETFKTTTARAQEVAQLLEKNSFVYDNPVAKLEHALKLWKNGRDPNSVGDSTDPLKNFVWRFWEEHVNFHLSTIKQLTVRHWGKIEVMTWKADDGAPQIESDELEQDTDRFDMNTDIVLSGDEGDHMPFDEED
ncbi:hypothetical protein FA15DRAFT_705506 [Coprinopsis marcescibilis]|uniref:DUF6532 domain-containing protein n=1 Tax=Coprinopsis marcescibilis TaxID=230819 RepID=A0A5C3KS38_COPMA|nr:hypothetical protein FA15DRAFT_705506 [Coprinopsis marcescibilis]